MIIGIGIDIIEVERIKNSLQKYKERFLKRVFTLHEKQYCESKAKQHQHYAVRFAGKEAMLKAVGSGLRDGISWQDIEFVNDKRGKPQSKCHGKLLQLIEKMKVKNILVSFSHSEKYAVAVIVLEG